MPYKVPKKLLAIKLFVGVLCSLTIYSIVYSQASEDFVKFSKKVKYRIVEDARDGFKLELQYKTYQFVPNVLKATTEARAAFVDVANNICKTKNNSCEVPRSTFAINPDRNGWSGNTTILLENWVFYKPPPTPTPSASKEAKEPAAAGKYSDLFACVVVIHAGSSIGSGFAISKDGIIVTAYHVIEEDKNPFVRFYDGRVTTGRVIDIVKSADLALVKVDSATHFLSVARQGEAVIGDEVIAIGCPMGLDYSVSKGIVSAVRTADGISVIQTDAAINSGNSGGPLILLKTGKVAGVNSFAFSKHISEGLNFAISANEIMRWFRLDN